MKHFLAKLQMFCIYFVRRPTRFNPLVDRREVDSFDLEFDAMPDSPYDLVAICTEARQSGQDFATIWEIILKHHPLVAGVPVSQMSGNFPALRIILRTGQQLQFDHYGFSVV